MHYTPCSTRHYLHTGCPYGSRLGVWCPYGLHCGWGRGAPMAFAVAREGHGVWGWKRSLVNAPHHTFSHMIQYHPPPSSSTPSTPSRTHARTHTHTHTHIHTQTHTQTDSHTDTQTHTHTPAPAGGKDRLFELGPGAQIKAMVKRLSNDAWKAFKNVAP